MGCECTKRSRVSCFDQHYRSHLTPTSTTIPLHIAQAYKSQSGFDGKFVQYLTGGVYVLTFSLAKLITFADFNYASMYPMCVICRSIERHVLLFCHNPQCTTRVMLSTHFIHTPVAVVSLHPLTSSWVLQVRVVFGRRGHGAMGRTCEGHTQRHSEDRDRKHSR